MEETEDTQAIKEHTRLMQKVNLGLAGSILISCVATLSFNPNVVETVLMHLGALIPCGITMGLLSAGRWRAAGWTLVLPLVVILWAIPIYYGGLMSPVSFMALIPVALAFFLIGPREGLVTALLSLSIATATLLIDPWLGPVLGANLVGTYITLVITIALPTWVMFATVTQLNSQRRIARREAAVAARANRTKSQFLANMSHELRTPLNAIIGYSELIDEEAEEIDAEELREHIGRVLSSSKHLLQLIRDVLDLSKVDAGQMLVESVDFQPKQLFETVVNTGQTLASTNGNVFVADLQLPDRFCGDPTRIKQCALNLISNAAKFTSEGEITLTVSHADGVLVIEVQDTGIGITPEQQQKLFVPFVQADASTTRRFGGTGLGLALTKELTELHGGTIEVTSEAGRGSVFRLRFPELPVFSPERSTS